MGHPVVASEWSARNERGIDSVTCGSGLRAWWCCAKCGHEWQAMVCARVAGTGCPACAGKVVTSSCNLAVEHPEVAAEWHTALNGDLRPENVRSGSGRAPWWQCRACSHEWKSAVASRTTRFSRRSPDSRGCARCAGRVATADHNFASAHPDVAGEWHPTRNADSQPADFTPSSGRKAWWLCSTCGHEWQASLCNRAKGTGCPGCEGLHVTTTNNLAARYPALAALWHPTKNDCGPADIVGHGSRRVWWLCDRCGHEWSSPVMWRAARKTGCPACAGIVVSDSNSLAALEPALAGEWHPERNGDLTPELVTTGSLRSVWWLCRNGHSWQTRVGVRARGQRSGCPRCVYAQSSRIERAVFKAVREVYPSAVSNVRWPRPDAPKRHVRPDIVIPELALVAEYDGAYWHAGREGADRERNRVMGDLGYTVVRVRESPLLAIGGLDVQVRTGATVEEIMCVLLPAIRDLADRAAA